MRRLLPLALSLVAACSSVQVADPGNTSETTNGARFVILDKDGLPAKGAIVVLRPTDYLSDSSRAELAVVPDRLVDAAGILRLDSLPASGVLELNFGRKGVLRWDLGSGAHPDTLRLVSPSALWGQVDRSALPAGVRIYVQIRGMEHVVRADSTGAFVFSSLPPGDQALRIFTSQASMGSCEGDTLRTRPGNQRDAGIFLLPALAWRDSVVVRELLDSSGLTDLPVDSVVRRNRDGRIVRLDLERRNLARLPSSIGSLRLRNLSIGGNLLDSLPASLGRIASLQVLSAPNNRLVSVPSSLGAIPDLRTLDLSGNLLQSLPDSLSLITSLESLFVANNRLVAVPEPVHSWLDLNASDTSSGGWSATQVP